LSSFVGDDAALIVMAGDGREVVHANAAGEAMVSAGFAPQTAKRLVTLAGGLAPLGGVRLERLDMSSPDGVTQVTCACRRLRLADGAVVLLVAAQAAPTRAGAVAAARAGASPDPAQQPQTELQTEPQTERPTEPLPLSAAPHPATPAAATPAAANPPGLAAKAGKARLLWEIEPDGRFRSLSAEVDALLGAGRAAAMIGRRWQDLDGDLVHDEGGAVTAALSAGKTWSGLPSLWRIGSSDQGLTVTLSGLPLSDQDRRLTGWRGFGVALAGMAVPFPAAAQPVPDAPATEAVAPDAPEPEAPEPEAKAADAVADASDAPAPAPALTTEPALQPQPASNVVHIRPAETPPRLTHSERNAFREIAKALGARIEGEADSALTMPHETARQPAAEPASPARSGMDDAGTQNADIATDLTADLATDLAANLAPELAADTASDSAAGLTADLAAELPPDLAEPPALPAPEAVTTAQQVMRLVPPEPGSDGMFAALLDKLPIGVLVLRAERMVYANKTLLDLLDHDNLDDLARVGTGRLFRGAMPGEGGGVFALTRRDGSHEAVDARLSAIAWQGEPATLMSFRRALETVDAARVEALKLDLAKAREQARELTAIMDTATDGVATMDGRGRILSLNRSAEALFGYDQREVTGENFTLLLAPESHITALDYLEGLKGGGVAALLNDGREVQGRVRQGGRIPLYMTLGRVADGDEPKYSAVLRDMTAWKRAEADLVDAKRNAEKASAQKSDVLAKISHEIRTPLNAILGFTEVMSEERFGPIGNERYKEYLSDIHQSGGYLISLINDLLDLAKIEAGKMDLTFTGVNLNEIASSAVALLQPEANRQRVVLRTGLQPKLPSVVADDRSLRQIVINILSNAVKFTDAGGQVILSTALGDRGEVILRVRDTGIGMTEKELGLAMEPFRQVASTRRTNSAGIGGTGLGLPITKALVEANKGMILITSAKNEGTLVEITFPPQRVLAS
jgi:PAS domain S-box-containing protein